MRRIIAENRVIFGTKIAAMPAYMKSSVKLCTIKFGLKTLMSAKSVPRMYASVAGRNAPKAIASVNVAARKNQNFQRRNVLNFMMSSMRSVPMKIAVMK